MIAVTRLAKASDAETVCSQQAARQLGSCEPGVSATSLCAVQIEQVRSARVLFTPHPPKGGSDPAKSHNARYYAPWSCATALGDRFARDLKSLVASLAAQAHGSAYARIIGTM